jgi:hypothetical protein
MKYVALIFWMLLTPVVAVGTLLFCLGMFGQEWFDLPTAILKGK